MEIEKKYLVNIEGERVEVGAADFYERNQGYAIAYRLEKNAQAKGEIAAKVMALCKPVLQSWRIFNPDDKDDFEQDCYFVTVMALESFDKNKGSFISWLRKYVQGRRYKKNEETIKKRDANAKLRAIVGDGETKRPWETSEEEDPDLGIDLQRIQKMVSPERYHLVQMRTDGATWEEMAETTGLSIPTIRKRVLRAYITLRDGVQALSDPGTFTTNMEDGSIFIRLPKLAARLDINPNTLYKMCFDHYPTKYRINPNHIHRIGKGIRFRYRIGVTGQIEWPEIVLRRPGTAMPLSRFARDKRTEDKRAEKTK